MEIDALLKNYEPFYNMVLSTTIMSNTNTRQFKNDANKIISFIGKAYKFDEEFIMTCQNVILDELDSLSLTTDQAAVYSNRKYGEPYSDKDALFDIKGDVLSKLHNLVDTKENPEVNPSWFDYSHYKTYYPEVRFAKIRTTSVSGNLIATRQVGILEILGIGCTKDIDAGIKRLIQCVYWGDIPSMYYLAYSFQLNNNTEKSNLFYEIAELADKYLKEGITILPTDIKEKYSEESCMYFALISSIIQDIIYAEHKISIDFSFVEAVSSNDLDYYKKMYFINNYKNKEWKFETNSSEKPKNKLGFN